MAHLSLGKVCQFYLLFSFVQLLPVPLLPKIMNMQVWQAMTKFSELYPVL